MPSEQRKMIHGADGAIHGPGGGSIPENQPTAGAADDPQRPITRGAGRPGVPGPSGGTGGVAGGEWLISNRGTLTAEKEADIPGYGVPVCLLHIASP